jgi:peptidoglycan/xylan/chitin deacetylase (PgdA/CDA1 family)
VAPLHLEGVPVTVYGVATALEKSPEQVAAMREAGWEIASHGLKWIDYKDFSEEAERAHLIEAIRHPHRGDGRAAARLVHRALARFTPRNW